MKMEKLMKKCEETNQKGKASKIFIDTNQITPEFITFSEIIECKICSGVVVDAICCKFCDNIFCKDCITDWLKIKINECPFRCEFQEFKIRPTTKNMIHKIKLFCRNKDKGCSEILDYENYYKHLENCEYFFYECNGCNMKGRKSEIKSHVLKCEKLYKNCQFCFEKFTLTEIESHYETCQMFEMPCKYCSMNIKRYNFEKHFKSECKECPVVCEFCNISYKRKSEPDHTKKVCFDFFYKNLIKNDNNIALKEENIRLKKELDIKEQTIRELKMKYEKNGNNNQKNNIFDNCGAKIENTIKNGFSNFPNPFNLNKFK
jgi:hypothetical protein